jgi:hypothetical protein
VSRSPAALVLVATALALLVSGCDKSSGGEASTRGGTSSVSTQTSPPTTSAAQETLTGEVAPSTVSEGLPKALPPDATLLPAAGGFAASGLQAQTDCRGRTGVARLTWRPAPESGPQRVAVTILPEVSDPHDFDLVRVVPETADSLLWKGLEGQAIHTWIVLTEHARGWAPSAPASFTGPSCKTDLSSP